MMFFHRLAVSEDVKKLPEGISCVFYNYHCGYMQYRFCN